MTVRPLASITSVPGPRWRRTSSLVPAAKILSPAIATASTNDGTRFVAIFALCRMTSTGTETSFATRKSLFLLRRSRGDDVLREARRRGAVDHRVGVLHAHAVGPAVGLHDVHHRVVRVLVRPIALPLEHHGERGDRLGARLDHALHRVVVSELTDVAAAVLDDVDLVAVVEGLNRRQRDAGFGPQASEHDLFPPAFLDGGDEVLVVP